MTHEPSKKREASEPLDPTRVLNQPALRTSTGGIWVLMGTLFAAVSLVPFGFLIFAGDGSARLEAGVAALLIFGCYLLLLVTRFTTQPGTLRLRLMAVCMLTMALVALIGALVCVFVASAAAA